MKKTLGIFGDSFAAQDEGVPEADYMSWPILLKEDFDVVNYAASNSSFFYSVKQFLENHFKHDYVILHVTNADRLYLEEKNSIIRASDGKKIRHVKANAREMLDSVSLKIRKNLEILNAIELYYTYIINNEKENYCYKLMLEDVKSKREDLIVLDLWSWYFKENEFFLYHPSKTLIDLRKNHLTKTNHKMVYNYIKDKINGKDVNLDQYYRIPLESYKYYFYD